MCKKMQGRHRLFQAAYIGCAAFCCLIASVDGTAALASPPASASPEQPRFFTYAEGRGAIPINVSTQRIAVQFEDGVSALAQASVLAHEDALNVSEPIRSVGHTRTRAVALAHGLGVAAVVDAVHRLRAAQGVRYAAPVIYTAPGKEEATSNNFYLSLRTPPNEAELKAINDAYGVEVVQTHEYKKIKRIGYWLSATRSSTLCALALCNVYYERLKPSGAGPCFTPLYSILTGEPPDDPKYKVNNVVQQWHLEKIGMPDAWDLVTGSPDIVVAVLDNGVQLNYGTGYPGHPDLNGNQWTNPNPQGDPYGWDFVDDDAIPDESEGDPHGTCSAGVVAAVTNNNTGVASIAGGWGTQHPGCKIMPVRVTPPLVGDNSTAVANGINYAVEHGAHVITMSLGMYTLPEEEQQPVEEARAQGCVLVAAAGNDDGYPSHETLYPGEFPEVIRVGGVNRCDPETRKYGSVSEYPYFSYPDCNPGNSGPYPVAVWGSNFGYSLDIMAPAVAILTTKKGSAYSEPASGMDYYYCKTSSATPQVAGAAALLLSATLDPDTHERTLSPVQVQAILQFSAHDLVYDLVHREGEQDEWTEEGTVGRDIYTGYGRLDVKAAIDLARLLRFTIRDQDRKHLASIDSQGNFVAEGNLFSLPSSDPADASVRAFRVKSSTGATVALVNKDEFTSDWSEYPDATVQAGSFITKGKVYKRVTVDLDSTNEVNVPCLRIWNAEDHTVALIARDGFTNSDIEPAGSHAVPAGSLILKGRAFYGSDPDRESSQGE